MFPVKGLISSRQKIGGPTSERKINSSIELMVGPNAQRGDVKRRYQMTSPRGGLERPRRIRISGTGDGAYAVERWRNLTRSGGRRWRFREMERERRTTKRVNRGGAAGKGGKPQEFHSLLRPSDAAAALLKNEEEMKFHASWRERETTRRTDGMEWSITQSGGEGNARQAHNR